MENIIKFIEDGFNIRKNSDGTYTVFTVPTQHFNVSSLTELTPEKFEEEAHAQLIKTNMSDALVEAINIKSRQDDKI